MSNAFRELLKKVGSGPHTGKDLTREEAAEATRMMLQQLATPAQIGAFMIAHRIKRPTGEELAGMLDAYDELGTKLQPSSQHDKKAIVFGVPYDGRSRTAPIIPLTTLILAASGVPTILHGGDTMPTKYGIPLVDIWQGLGVNWRTLSLAQVQKVFETVGIGFIYLPQHFRLASGLVSYRDEIGKRPPFATMELIWCPYDGEADMVSGFVHPPTENMFLEALKLRGMSQQFITVKGLEGSCDLPRDRTAIISVSQPAINPEIERLLLHPRDYGFEGKEVPLESLSQLLTQIQEVCDGKPSELLQAAIWNGGFYLWRCGVCQDIESGFAEAERLLTNGLVAKKLDELSKAVSNFPLAVSH